MASNDSDSFARAESTDPVVMVKQESPEATGKKDLRPRDTQVRPHQGPSESTALHRHGEGGALQPGPRELGSSYGRGHGEHGIRQLEYNGNQGFTDRPSATQPTPRELPGLIRHQPRRHGKTPAAASANYLFNERRIQTGNRVNNDQFPAQLQYHPGHNDVGPLRQNDAAEGVPIEPQTSAPRHSDPHRQPVPLSCHNTLPSTHAHAPFSPHFLGNAVCAPSGLPRLPPTPILLPPSPPSTSPPRSANRAPGASFPASPAGAAYGPPPGSQQKPAPPIQSPQPGPSAAAAAVPPVASPSIPPAPSAWGYECINCLTDFDTEEACQEHVLREHVLPVFINSLLRIPSTVRVVPRRVHDG